MQPYDVHEQELAVHLARTHPRWLVIWGSYSRLYWAFPGFVAPRGTLLCAATPDDLVAQMRQAEMDSEPGNRGGSGRA